LLTRRDRRTERVVYHANDALPQSRSDLTTGSALLQKDFKKVWRRNVTLTGVLTEERREEGAAQISTASDQFRLNMEAKSGGIDGKCCAAAWAVYSLRKQRKADG
jgi:hypothetical protein